METKDKLTARLNDLFRRRGDLDTIEDDIRVELEAVKAEIKHVRRRLSELTTDNPKDA